MNQSQMTRTCTHIHVRALVFFVSVYSKRKSVPMIRFFSLSVINPSGAHAIIHNLVPSFSSITISDFFIDNTRFSCIISHIFHHLVSHSCPNFNDETSSTKHLFLRDFCFFFSSLFSFYFFFIRFSIQKFANAATTTKKNTLDTLDSRFS